MSGDLLRQAATLRAEAKALRKRARELDAEAAGLEGRYEADRRRAATREAAEVRAASHARPVWRDERQGGPWVVLAVEGGAFHVAPPPMPGQLARDVTRYHVSTGTPAGYGLLHEERRRLGALDPRATLTAWRSWCEARRAGSSS